MYHRVRSAAVVAHYSKVNGSKIRTVVKKKKKGKEICEAVAAAVPAGTKTLHFLLNIFSAHTENAAFIWVQYCYRKCILID